MRLNDLFENDSLKDYFKQLQKTDPKFSNLRIHGDPEHDELRRQDQAAYQARQKQTAAAAKDNKHDEILERNYKVNPYGPVRTVGFPITLRLLVMFIVTVNKQHI